MNNIENNKLSIDFLEKNVNIKSGKFLNLIPEFYDLKSVIENNDWHNKENVFNHTLSVLNSLEKVLRNLNKKTKQFLDKKINSNSRKSLLKTATLFHDIAKKETLINNDDTTMCLNHEEKGSKKVEKILKRFNLSNSELEIIINIVKYHGLMHKILSPQNQNFQKEYANFRKKFFNNIYPELILLAYADTIGSHLKKTHPLEFKARINFYKKEIKNLLSSHI